MKNQAKPPSGPATAPRSLRTSRGEPRQNLVQVQGVHHEVRVHVACDTAALDAWVAETIADPANAKSVGAYRGGKESAIGALVGALMECSKHQADAKAAKATLERMREKHERASGHKPLLRKSLQASGHPTSRSKQLTYGYPVILCPHSEGFRLHTPPAARRPPRKFVGVALRCGLGVVFLLAVLNKAVDPRETDAALKHLLSGIQFRSGYAFVMLLAAELAIAAALIAGVAIRTTLCCVIVMLSGFTVWLVALALSGSEIKCGCGFQFTWLKPGVARALSIGRNIGLIALAVLAWRLNTVASRDPSVSVPEFTQTAKDVPNSEGESL